MTLGADPVLRWLRASVVATVAVGFGSLAHALAGGQFPGVPVLAFTALALTALAAALLGGPASYPRLLVLVAGGQTAVHLVLTSAAGHSPGGHASHDAVTSSSPDIGATVGHLLADLNGPHLAMTAAHFAAAGIVALWLLVGERALWTLVALLGRHVVDCLALQVRLSAVPRRRTPEHRLTAPAWLPPCPQALAARTGPLGRRGPPAACSRSFTLTA